MKIYKYIILAIAAFVTTLLDTSFFSFIDIFEASIISTFSALLVLTILNFKREALYFASFSILFYTIFSSVPVYLLFLLFFGISTLFYLAKIKVAINLKSIFWVIIIFLVSNFLFDLFLLLLFGGVTADSLTSLFFFVIINTIFGIILFYLSKILIKYFNIEVKES